MSRLLRNWSDDPFVFPPKKPGVQYSPGPRFNRMRIPLAYQSAKLETIAKRAPENSPPYYLSAIRHYISNLRENLETGMGLYLCGKPGSGKSSAAAIICKAAVYHIPAVLFASAEEVCRASIENMGFDDDETLQERMRSVDLLVIDDLGREHSKEYGKSQVESLLRHRYDRLLSTVITSNIAVDKLGGVSIVNGEERIDDPTKYGATVQSVVDEKYKLVKVDGIEWRAAATDENRARLKPELMLSPEELRILRGETK